MLPAAFPLNPVPFCWELPPRLYYFNDKQGETSFIPAIRFLLLKLWLKALSSTRIICTFEVYKLD